MPQQKVICFINMKGGVGKTTLSVNVAYTLAKMFHKKVALIDLDPQMNATQYTLDPANVQDLLLNPQKTVYGIFEPPMPSLVTQNPLAPTISTEIYNIDTNFDLIPSHLQIMMSNIGEHPLRLRKYINDNLTQYDVVIIDSPPTISGYTKAALLASTHYVVPMKIDYLSLFGLPLLENYITSLSSEYTHTINFEGIILTMVRTDYIIYKSLKEQINKNPIWRSKLFTSESNNRISITNSLSPNNSDDRFIVNFTKDLHAKNQIIDITREFIQKLRI